MGLITNRIQRDQLKIGDHIYSYRHAYIYAHHGIYIGGDIVVHFTCGVGQEVGTGTVLDRFIVSSSPAGTPCLKCGDQSNLSGVISSCLDCFLSGGGLYLFEYGVSKAVFLSKIRGGTCTLASAEPVEDVLYRVSCLLENGFGVYDISKNNCEDFAVYCKTSLIVCTDISSGRSGQATAFYAAKNAIRSLPLRFLTTSVFGITAVNYCMYTVSRLASDVGFRSDVMKLPVERLVARSVVNGSQPQVGLAEDQ